MLKSPQVKRKNGPEYPFDAPPAAGSIREVADGVYWLRMPLPFALDHINLWLLEDGDGWVIVDCGFGDEATRMLWRRIFAEQQLLEIGGRSWRVITGRGHSPEHAALACAELGILIAGDRVLPRISTNVSVQPHLPDADPLADFLASLARYAELDAGTLVLPAHGLPFYGLRERVTELRRHHDERLAEVERACAEPRTTSEVMPVLFKRALDAQQTFFAMGETLSHLNYLRHRRQLRRERTADGLYRYARA